MESWQVAKLNIGTEKRHQGGVADGFRSYFSHVKKKKVACGQGESFVFDYLASMIGTSSYIHSRW